MHCVYLALWTHKVLGEDLYALYINFHSFIHLASQVRSNTYLVVNHHSFNDGLVKHLLVPILQTLGLGDLLLWWVTVENVVITLWRWAGPNVSHGVTQLFGILQVANEDFMVHCCTDLSWAEEMNTVQVGDIDTPATENRKIWHFLKCQQTVLSRLTAKSDDMPNRKITNHSLTLICMPLLPSYNIALVEVL